ncbi:MAG: bifunctional 5,10-methylenetetrahydrofolate dehydrogenase/5,10-methenyltetrahydrofolate cyclohydrolase [Oscillospiraceae bacterium]|nr:bifunctional 5,10-methylenetetrahydrofolate dehydrogenase/5,10-methenyltetrahydrofolate cyclohydrolase [Oscillospiraceae bacterium]
MANILDGNALAKQIKEQIAEQIARDKLEVSLAVVLVGDDPASRIYVNHKKRDCEQCGITSHEYILPAEATQAQVIELVQALNGDDEVNGVLIQQPFPMGIDVVAVNEAVSAFKDVDGFRAETVGRLAIGAETFKSCTPAGVMELIKSTGVQISGKECVVVGRSNIVGKPMALMLLNESGTVTVCHSRTRDLAEVTRRADILVSAVGVANLITADMVKEGAVVIDVGMNRGGDGKLCGDVEFAAVSAKIGDSGWITPVPGGVGPMTRAMLMSNTLAAFRMQRSSSGVCQGSRALPDDAEGERSSHRV